MERKKSEEERNASKFDFTQPELDYILSYARFNEIQTKVFNRLTDRHGRQSIVKISMEENISISTVNRIIKQIKSKILRVL
jgi:hypothetical protein